MKSSHGRNTIRGKRNAPKKRLVLRPPTKRTALLSGTSLAGGALAALVAMAAFPNSALADCVLIDGPVAEINCSADDNDGFFGEFDKNVDINVFGNATVSNAAGDAMDVRSYGDGSNPRTIDIDHAEGADVSGLYDGYDLTIDAEGGGILDNTGTLNAVIEGSFSGQDGQGLDLDIHAVNGVVDLTLGENSEALSYGSHAIRLDLSNTETTDITVEANGDIITGGGDGFGGDGILIFGSTNEGDGGNAESHIEVVVNGSTNVDGVGVNVYAVNGPAGDENTIDLTNNGPSITGSHGLQGTSSGNINIILTNNGSLDAGVTNDVDPDADGLRAIQDSSGTGNITIANNGSIDAADDGIRARISNVDSNGTIDITNTGIIGTSDLSPVGSHGINVDNRGDGKTTVNLIHLLDDEDAVIGMSAIRSIGNGVDVVHRTSEGDIEINSWAGTSIIAGGDGIRAVQWWNSVGSIDVDNHGDITSEGDGVHVRIDNDDSEGTIYVYNEGTIISGGDGIFGENDGTGTTTIINNSLASIHSDEHGINLTNNGGLLTIINGDGLGDNPDGLIDADMTGIRARNFNGGNIVVYNGFLTSENPDSSNSQIYARGDYGIDARSRADDGDEGDGFVDVFNMGLVQLESDGIAGVRARTSGDTDGYAAFWNGIMWDGEDVRVAVNARVNAYEFGIDTEGDVIFNTWDADGVHLIKNYGAGSYDGMHPFDGDPLAFGVFGVNMGVWDFTGADHYLTPGFMSDGTPLMDGDIPSATTGGIYAPAGTAILIDHEGENSSGFMNFGTVIGQGNRWDPVIDVNTEYYGEVEGDSNLIFIYNAFGGLIGSANTPSGWSMSLEDQLTAGFGYFEDGSPLDPILMQNSEEEVLGRFVNVDWDHILGNIGDDPGQLGSFADAANDRLLQTNWGNGTWPGMDGGAPLILFNDGLLIGQLRLNSEETEGGDYGLLGDGNFFWNSGAWFVTGTNRFFGGDEDILLNTGLVQTGFAADVAEETRFHGLNGLANYGVLSMIDTPTGSTDGIFDTLTTTGDYYGGGLGVYFDGRGFLGVDTFLGTEDGVDGVGSDRFIVEGKAYGSTGIIVHKLNEEAGGINTDGILVARVESGVGDGGACGDFALCADGNTFYISEFSQNYQEIGGYGTIRDGFFAWYLEERPVDGDEIDPEYYLIGDFGPEGSHQPVLVSAAQNIWYETGGVVEDHVYGNVYPNSGAGGAGADLDYGYVPMPTPQAKGHSSALWGRANGNWMNRDTDVIQDVNGTEVTIDTSLNQNTYGLLAGLEFQPNGGDNGVRLGVFGGWVGSHVDFTSYDASAKYNGGTIGGYAALTNGGFYVDAEVKGDFMTVDYTTPFVDVSGNARNLGVLANAGYRMENAGGFIEPIASLAFVHTSLDTDEDAGDVEISYDNGSSIRAGIGGRVGTTFASSDGYTTELSVLGKLWNEFGGPNTVTITDLNTLDSATFSDDISGVFGEVTGMATVYSADRRTSGFIQGGARFGDSWTTITAKGGVRQNF